MNAFVILLSLIFNRDIESPSIQTGYGKLLYRDGSLLFDSSIIKSKVSGVQSPAFERIPRFKDTFMVLVRESENDSPCSSMHHIIRVTGNSIDTSARFGDCATKAKVVYRGVVTTSVSDKNAIHHVYTFNGADLLMDGKKRLPFSTALYLNSNRSPSRLPIDTGNHGEKWDEQFGKNGYDEEHPVASKKPSEEPTSTITNNFINTAASSSKQIAQVLGYKEFKFGMTTRQVLAIYDGKPEVSEFPNTMFYEKMFGAPVDANVFSKSKSPNEVAKEIQSFGGVKNYIDTIFNKESVYITSNDMYCRYGRGSAISIDSSGIELMFYNDTLYQVRLLLQVRKPDGNVLEILTEKYGKPKIEIIKTTTTPIIGNSSTLTSFTFDAVGGRVRLFGVFSKNEILEMNDGQSGWSNNRNDLGQRYVDSSISDIYMKLLKRYTEKSKEMTPILLTYTQADLVRESGSQVRNFIAKWKKESQIGLEAAIEKLKKKNRDEY